MLVADDERDIVELVAFVLRRAGYDVVEASDGEQALRLARERLPALCILDGRMPELAGFEILRRLRADPRTAAIPVLILTATVDEERAILRHGVEPDGFMKKPFEADALLDRGRAPAQIDGCGSSSCGGAGVPQPSAAIELVREEMDGAGIEPDRRDRARDRRRRAGVELEDFHGSPTIRVDGRDVVEPSDQPIGLTCRVYRRRDGRISALPDRADIAAALAAAEGGSRTDDRD